MRSAYAAAVLLLACTACRGPRPYLGPSIGTGGAGSFAGCYEASPPAGRASDSNHPWSFVLDTITPEGGRPGSGERVPGAMWARTSNQGRYSSYWRMIPGGIQIYVGDSLHGWRVEFFPRGDQLVGRDYSFSDVWRGFQAERVSARRVPCAPADAAEA